MVAGSYADTFGSGANQFTINFVNIGHAGNVADSTGYGDVGYNYRMGKYEVTVSQFSAAQAVDNRIGDGNESFWNDGTLVYGTGIPAEATMVGGDAPTARVSWYEAATFANWLTTGDAYTGVYQFNNSGVLVGIDRDAAVGIYGTVYVIPTEDEWYKTAYYKSDGSGYTLYATGDSAPVAGVDARYRDGITQTYTWSAGSGSIENNGTYDMGGNVCEWNESAVDGVLNDLGENRVARGGHWINTVDTNYYPGASSLYRASYGPSGQGVQIGFRVAAIPEPSSLALMALVGGSGWMIRRKFRR